MKKISMTIITGYLGSGKTTLLRNIVKQSKMRIAILMNEFGEIGIDSKIVKGKNIEMAELVGGCVCCSLSGEFEAAVAEILERVKPDWIVVETTGVAEPTALAYDIVENINGVKLDSIVTIIDADALIRFPSLGHTGTEQIELADILILNKTDLVSKEQLELIKNKIKDINSRAVITECEFCEFDLKLIFGVDRSRAVVPHKQHKLEFEYFDFEENKGKLNYDKFIELLETLPKEIYRAKGFVKTDKGDFLINYVAGRLIIENFECKMTEFVFIGKNIFQYKEKMYLKLSKIHGG